MATTLQPAAGEGTKQLINYRVDGGVAVIEMNDPPANTYTYEMNRQFDEAILKARMANDVYVIVLTGAGEKFFSAGANIKMLSSVDPTFKYYFWSTRPSWWSRPSTATAWAAAWRLPWRPTFVSLARNRARSACRK
jgi:enoyl-CoA hydratase/carnithine racemase